MRLTRPPNLLATALVGALAFTANAARAADPLPSWNEGRAKQSIIAFVAKVTTAGSPDFVPVPERIATFDNDGTLCAEQPMYFQALFIFDRIRCWCARTGGTRRSTTPTAAGSRRESTAWSPSR
jgi:hypothetical protein